MNELTLEEKARAYDEALERAKKVNKCEADDREPGTSICEYIFPEIHEHEDKDEMVRKCLINGMTFYLERWEDSTWGTEKFNMKVKDILEWLEKQDKGKFVSSNKHDWSKEDEYRLEILNALCWDKLLESVPNSTMYEEMKTTINWLSSLRTQSKQEWNEKDKDEEAGAEEEIGGEEDLERINRIADFIWKNRKGDTDEIYQQEQDVNWLKSLKEHITWKPNDKQMHAFEQVYDWYNNNFMASETLTSLYNDLKKLKGK